MVYGGDGDNNGENNGGGSDEDIPTKHAPSNSTPTSTPTTPAPAQAIDGAITRRQAKKLQQEVNTLLCESSINVNENIILPKCSTLVVLRYTHEEGGDLDRKDCNNTVQNGPVERRADRTSVVQNGPVERKDHNFHFRDAMKAHEHLWVVHGIRCWKALGV